MHFPSENVSAEVCRRNHTRVAMVIKRKISCLALPASIQSLNAALLPDRFNTGLYLQRYAAKSLATRFHAISVLSFEIRYGSCVHRGILLR